MTIKEGGEGEGDGGSCGQMRRQRMKVAVANESTN